MKLSLRCSIQPLKWFCSQANFIYMQLCIGDYINYEDFIKDFKPVLKATRDDFTWLIDAL